MDYIVRGTGEGGGVYDSRHSTLQEAQKQADWLTAYGYKATIEGPDERMKSLRRELIAAGTRSAQDVPPPPRGPVSSEDSDAAQPSNVVPFRRREKTVTEYSPTEAVDIFNEAMKRNKENRERLAKERAKSNKAVTRNYDLNGPKGGK